MRHRNRDLFCMLCLALLNTVQALLARIISLETFPVLTIGLVLPLVLIVPGYALTEIFFPRQALDVLQRAAFSLALSVALVMVSGLLLNFLPVGLTTLPWVLWLGLLSALLIALALVRRARPQSKTKPLRRTPLAASRERRRLQVQAAIPPILFGLAMLVLIGALISSANGASQQSYPGFTNLWITPASTGSTCAVVIGMQSFEGDPLNYRVVMATNQAPTGSWNVIALAPTEQWFQQATVPTGNSTALFVLIQVYRLNHLQTVYRHVNLTLHVHNKGSTSTCTSA